MDSPLFWAVQLIKQGYKKILFYLTRNSDCYSNKREKNATDATITIEFRLMKLILLINGN